MNYISFLGKNINEIDLDPSSYQMEFEDWMIEEGLEPTWTVKANSENYEISLNEDKMVECIWLFPIDGKFSFNNYASTTTKEEIKSQLGTPTSHGEFVQSPIDFSFIDWIRYDKENYSIHFEFSATNGELLKITLMDILVAP